MAGEQGKQAFISSNEGAAAGAALGTSIMPGWGTAIGAVIGGIVGGIEGAFEGAKVRKSKKYQKLAAQVQQQRERNQDYEKFLQLVRQQRIARASTLSQAVASGLDYSSAVSGAVSGQQSQTAHGINYLAEDRRLQELYLSYMNKAGKAASIARDINSGFNLANSLVIQAANIVGTSKGLGKLPSTQGTQGTVGTTGQPTTGTNDMTISYN